MNICIIIDKNSTASKNIKDKLINHSKVFFKSSLIFENEPVYQYKNAYIITTKTDSIECENIDANIKNILAFEPHLLIFATTHKSKSEIPCLTAHAPGNWYIAEMGGLDKNLCISAEGFIKEALIFLKENISSYPQINHFEVTGEVTHHGPFTKTPTMFIEIGSTQKEWDENSAGEIISQTLIYLIDEDNNIKNKYETAIGIGGLHTCPNFNKITFYDEKIAISHICPKYMLEYLDEEMIEHAIKSSIAPAKHVIVDWKSLGEQKTKVKELLEKLKIEYKKTKQFKY